MNRSNFFAFLACALLSTPALAQNAPPAPKAAELSPTERLERSAESLAKMKSAMKQVLSRAEEARNEKDVVKLNCVNEKLTQIKGLLKVAEQADIALHEAVAKQEPGADAEYQKISIARTKIEALRSDSEQCIGQLAYIVDEKTTVEVQAPGDLPDRGNGTERRAPAPPVVRPPPASPFR